MTRVRVLGLIRPSIMQKRFGVVGTQVELNHSPLTTSAAGRALGGVEVKKMS